MPLKNIPNDDIVRVKHIIRNEPVIDIRNIPGGGYFEVREPSPVHEYNGLQMFTGTCVRKVKQKDSRGTIIYPGKVNEQGYVDEHSLHGWTADFRVDKKKWDYRGRLNTLDTNGRFVQLEDPDFLWDDVRKRWFMAVENKTAEKKYGLFKISFFVSVTEDFFGDWQIVPGLELVPSGNGWYKSAFYSPHFYSLLEMVVDGRNIKGVPNTEAAGYVKLASGIYVPDPQPTLAIEHLTYLNPKFVTIGIGNLWKINNKPVMQIAGLRDWSYEIWEKAQPNVYNGYWCQMMATSNSPRERWTLINKELVTDKGERTTTIFFYYESEDKWYALDKLPGSKSFCLAEIVTESGSKPPKPNGGGMKPVITLKDNKLTCEPFLNTSVNDYMWHSQEEMDKKGNPYFGRGISIDIPERLQVDGGEFWVYCKLPDGSHSPDSNRVFYVSGTVEPILGCMNPKASNYNPNATVDDGSCILPGAPFDKTKVNASLDNIKTFVKAVENATTGITKEVNIIEAEVNKA